MRQSAACDRDPAAGQNILRAGADDVDLSHELVMKRLLEIGIGEGRKRFEYRASRRAHDCIDLADRAESCLNRSLLCDVGEK